MNYIFNFLTNFLFPQKCLFCKSNGNICCQKCFNTISENIFIHDNIISIYSYYNPENGNKINKLIWKMKYFHSGDTAQLFAPSLSENLLRKFSLNTNNNNKNIYLIPIPLNQNDKRLNNHAFIIANEVKNYFKIKNLEKKFNVNILENLLIKNAQRKQSHTKNRQERLENIKNAFTINSKININNSEKENLYILIDDVTTTGATINEARKVLGNYLKIDSKEILAVTIAH